MKHDEIQKYISITYFLPIGCALLTPATLAGLAMFLLFFYHTGISETIPGFLATCTQVVCSTWNQHSQPYL
jgi:hypothetical protein